jgi:hypothetical protein
MQLCHDAAQFRLNDIKVMIYIDVVMKICSSE